MTATSYRVRAHNSATASENKIHDDRVARDYGFAGGLVPGVTVYAYMTRPAVERWGRSWLEAGSMSARFLKPFYEGDEVLVALAPDGELTATNQAGVVCATGRASTDRGAVLEVPEAPLPQSRPSASPESLAPGRVLGSISSTFRADRAPEYLAEIDDDLLVYGDGVAHPGYLVRTANTVLGANVTLGPWIHVQSDVSHHGVVTDGDRVTTRARVADCYERKGHAFVELDVLVAVGDRPVMSIRHTAIYAPARRRRELSPGVGSRSAEAGRALDRKRKDRGGG